MPFEITTYVGWAMLDANAHMANTAYLDVAVDCRMAYFRSKGFGPAEMAKLAIGPVVKTDEVEYFREMHLLDEMRVTLQLAGISGDASRFRLRNEILRPDGKLVARINTTGGWFDLAARKLIAPPTPIAEALAALERTEDFQSLESSIK
jgi:acyl-CoA thioester hydrolase